MTFDLSSGWTVLPWLAAALLILAWTWWQRAGGGPLRQVVLAPRGGVLVALVAIGLNRPCRRHAWQYPPARGSRPARRLAVLLGSPQSRWQEATALARGATGSKGTPTSAFTASAKGSSPWMGRHSGRARNSPARTTPIRNSPPRSVNWPAGSA
jgi:hypothetical protein